MLKMFPEINHIDEVRVAIQGRPEFIEATREGYTIFNYMVAHEDSFDCPIRRECRGLVFDENGRVLSRRFHKFFNLGEKEHTLPDNINWDIPHVVLEKLDGSMITFSYVERELRAMTKMGITDISKQVDNFVETKDNYLRFVDFCIKHNHTAIFEWLSRQNKVVIDHPEDRLILLAIRENNTGKYVNLYNFSKNNVMMTFDSTRF